MFYIETSFQIYKWAGVLVKILQRIFFCVCVCLLYWELQTIDLMKGFVVKQFNFTNQKTTRPATRIEPSSPHSVDVFMHIHGFVFFFLDYNHVQYVSLCKM